MTGHDPAPLLIVTFGDPGGELWGAALSSPRAEILIGHGDDRLTGAALLDGGDADQDWRISGAGVELVAAATGESVPSTAPEGFDQLGRVRGAISIGGGELQVDCVCRRALRTSVDLAEVESVRDVSSWFESGDALALTSVRPSKAGGHDRDLVVAAVLDAGAEQAVADPRLSSAYHDDGRPLRAGLELWLSDEEDEEQQYPRRAAGEASGPGIDADDERYGVLATPFRWHSRGSDGAGVYLLVRRR